ncbi:hypothetical protein DBN73_16850, partial [Enterococcus faecalis]|nr:hypothetical protein [Enterococcus faecalis]
SRGSAQAARQHRREAGHAGPHPHRRADAEEPGRPAAAEPGPAENRAGQGQAEIAETQARAQKYGADAAETQSDTQIAQRMAPLEAQQLLAEIAKLIAETQGQANERAGLESPGPGARLTGGAAPGQAAAGPARGMPQQAGIVPRR